MVWLANDYFVPVTISLILLAYWFGNQDPAQRPKNQRGIIIAAISIGSACGFVLLANNIWRHPHPFEDMPELMATVNRIYYPIVDPPFPSNTSAVTFAAAASMWQFHRKAGLILLVPAILMPFAKVYACVYYPSDILGGAVLGIITAYFISKIMMRLFDPGVAYVMRFLRKICLA